MTRTLHRTEGLDGRHAPEALEAPREGAPPFDASMIRAIRLGHGANCSSVGSLVDTLFVGAALGGALMAAIAAAVAREADEADARPTERGDDETGETGETGETSPPERDA